MDLKELTLLRGVSGNEEALRKALVEACTPLCDQVTIDRMGNVVAKKQGTDPNAPHVLFVAHMDEVGLIVTSATEDGFLRVLPVGGIDPRVIISKRVLVGEKAIPGVIGAMAIHLQSADDRSRVMQFDSIYVDIGASSKEDALSDCPQGSYITFDTPYTSFGDGFVCAKALDDRVGCLTMIELLKGAYPVSITCLFTTQEEIGCRGAATAAYANDSDMALILEGTTCNDLGDVSEAEQVCRAGAGVAVSFMDNASLAYGPLYQGLLALGREKGIPCQEKRSVSGGNEGGVVQRAKGGRATCVLSVPCRYIHSPSSVVKLLDVEAQLALSKAFLESDLPYAIKTSLA